MTHQRIRRQLSSLLIIASLSACNKPTTVGHNEKEKTTQDKKLHVIASFSILGDIVQNIGGDRIQLTTLVGPEQDAHVYQPTPKDAQTIATAQLIFTNGLGFEGWLDRLKSSAQYKGDAVVASTGVQPLTLKEDGHVEDDPHAWQDISNVKNVYVKNILAGLVKADPSGATYYQQRAKEYSQQLDALNTEYETAFSKISDNERKVVTSHDAFAYFGQHYNVKFLAPQGVSTESEASAKHVAQLIQQIKQEQVKAIFVENISNSKLLEQITKETGAQIGGQLYSDALSIDTAPANTYLNMMKHNLHSLIKVMK